MAKRGDRTRPEKSVELFLRATSPAEKMKARDGIIIENQGYIRACVAQIANPVPHILSLDDLIQHGIVGLVSALDRYDPSNEVSFRSWAYLRIRGAAQDAIRRVSPKSRTRNVTPVPLEEVTEKVQWVDPAFDAIESALPPASSLALRNAITTLPLRQAVIILLLYNGVSIAGLAAIYDMSTSRVIQERKAALAHLREDLQKDVAPDAMQEPIKPSEELWREKPEWCDFCGWKTDVLTLTGEEEYQRQRGVDPQWLCDLCRATPAGNYALHPSVNQSMNPYTLKTIITIGHVILAEVRNRPPSQGAA